MRHEIIIDINTLKDSSKRIRGSLARMENVYKKNRQELTKVAVILEWAVERIEKELSK